MRPPEDDSAPTEEFDDPIELTPAVEVLGTGCMRIAADAALSMSQACADARDFDDLGPLPVVVVSRSPERPAHSPN